jgi:hypothetical protein
MPNALRARKACEMDRNNTLGTKINFIVSTTELYHFISANAFDKWTKAYQTKITLKAVACVSQTFVLNN